MALDYSTEESQEDCRGLYIKVFDSRGGTVQIDKIEVL